MNYFSDEKEWQWMFDHGINWDKIIPLFYPSFPTEDGIESREELIAFLKELLTQTGEWAGTSVLAKAQKIDIEGAGKVIDGKTIPGETLSKFYQEATELGAFGLPLPAKFGGMGLPSLSLMILLGQLSRSCLAQCTQLAFFTSIADMVHRFCDKEDQDRIIPQIVEGKLSGSMCLTEPGSGSDLSKLKTSATPTDDGMYLLNGNKIFITNGGGGICFVLARIKGDAEGLDGISMFLCEQDLGDGKNNYIVAKNEHKMGMHGTFTCELVFENSKAKLVGERGKGFKYMLHLMNEARIAVGIQGLGGIEGAIGYAVKYANEREQFDKPISELPLMKRNLQDFEVERDALRALLVDTISWYDIFQKLDLKKNQNGELNKEEAELYKEASMWTRKRTPLVKYYACEANVTLTQRAIQVLGGYGYMKEYPVERYHRDSFGPLLYEGTSQVQALMALKDLVKFAMKDPKTFFAGIVSRSAPANLMSDAHECEKEFNSLQFTFKTKTLALLAKCLKPGEIKEFFNLKAWMKEENVEGLMEHAETLCQAMSYLETLRVLAWHAKKDDSRKELFNDYKRLITPRLEMIYSDWSLRS